MIKNIIFDVGNVLVNFRPEELMRDLDFPQEVIDRLNKEVVLSELWSELDLSIRPMDEVFEDMINLIPEYKEYTRKFFSKPEELCIAFDYSETWVKSFKDKGFNTFVLSNYSRELWELHESCQFPFLPYLDGKIVSGYVNLIKPDEKIYRLLLDTYNLNAEECVFFDDREDNIKAAEQLGIKGILFKNIDDAKKKFELLLQE